MSHEIRTPLNGVIGVADLLARDSLTPHQSELVEMIRSSSASLNRLLSDILDLARIETGKLEITHEPFHLAEAVRSAAALFAIRAEEKGIAFKLQIDPAAEILVEGDPVRLKQILGNLMSNAIKFTEAGAVRVTVDRPGGAGPFRFVVRDSGPGFDEETRARLFHRFEQADGSITRRYGGSGLGLAICRELAELLGGELTCVSQPGDGACFTLELDLPAAADQQRVDRDETDPAAAIQTALRILVVDDHPHNRRFLEILLGGAGIEVVCADNGRDGVAAWRAGGFDAVLMDMQMPVLDGLAATREMRAREQALGLPHTPVIMVSANALAEHVEASQAAGADLHISKPIVAAELFDALGALETVKAVRSAA